MGKRKLGGSSLLGREPDTYILPTTTTPGVAIVSTSVPGVFVEGTVQASAGADWNAAVGAAGEILNKPTIPPAQVNADWAATSGVEQVLNKPVVAVNSLTVSSTTGANGPTARDISVQDSDGNTTKSTLPVPLIPWSSTADQVPVTTTTSGDMVLKDYNTIPQSQTAGRIVGTTTTEGTFQLMNDDIILPLPTQYNTVKTARMWNKDGYVVKGDPPINVLPQSQFAGRLVQTSTTEGTFDLTNDDLVLPLPASYNSNKADRMWNKGGFVVKGDPDINTFTRDNVQDKVVITTGTAGTFGLSTEYLKDAVTNVTVSSTTGGGGPTSRDIVVTDADGTVTTSTLPVPLIPWVPLAGFTPTTTATSGEMALSRYNVMPTSAATSSLVRTSGTIGTFDTADDHIVLPPATSYDSANVSRWWNNDGFICVGNTGNPIKNVSLNSTGTTLTVLKFDGNQTVYTLPSVPLIQHGEIFVGNTTNAGYSVFNVTFATGYTSKPTITFNAHQGGPARNTIVDVYGTNITASGFSANLFDSQTTGPDVVIHWIAVGS